LAAGVGGEDDDLNARGTGGTMSAEERMVMWLRSGRIFTYGLDQVDRGC
jgi:hypothetical protein